MIEYEKLAINLMRNCREGVLSTVSKKYEGYPFGSFVTFISGADRSLIFYASDIAQHTINLKNNSKACITLFNLSEGDKQDSARLSLIGDVKKIDKDVEEISRQFIEFFPESSQYSNMHDFNFYKLNISQVRWIGGFGKIAWLSSTNWNPIRPKWLKKEHSMIEHMNEDHSNSIVSALNAKLGIKDKHARMLRLTMDGYYVSSKNKIYFLDFNLPCFTVKQYRDKLVEQAKEYRDFEL
ncbi:MAG: hypothetical protein CMI87_02515, partial [Pelagibacteraceae bacterium]|nr:hypothetical protein [Pelagibacteraceae bacterium]